MLTHDETSLTEPPLHKPAAWSLTKEKVEELDGPAMLAELSVSLLACRAFCQRRAATLTHRLSVLSVLQRSVATSQEDTPQGHADSCWRSSHAGGKGSDEVRDTDERREWSSCRRQPIWTLQKAHRAGSGSSARCCATHRKKAVRNCNILVTGDDVWQLADKMQQLYLRRTACISGTDIDADRRTI